jgi:hypothetical protein
MAAEDGLLAAAEAVAHPVSELVGEREPSARLRLADVDQDLRRAG